MSAKNNVTIVYHIPSGEPRAVIIDAASPAVIASMNINNDPGNHAHIPVPVDQYNSFNHHQFHQYMMSAIQSHQVLLSAQTISASMAK